MKKIIVTLICSAMLFTYIPFSERIVYANDIGIDVYENGMSREEYYQQTIDQYAEFDYSDPNTTTDEELFGAWNGEEWVQGPLLDYERFPALIEIEEAAKSANGNYDVCKQLILDYYNAKFDTFNLATDSVVYAGDKYRLTAEMQMENFFIRPAYGPYPLSKMLVSEEEKWHSSTVLDAVTKIIESTDKRVTLHVYALKKDGYTVKFNSIDSGENIPYIEANVNGTTKKFEAVMDTYVSAGDNQKINYGAEPQLLVEESYTSINEPSTSDSYTRRAVLKFDFSEINPTDKITYATLHLYGSMEKSDNPTESGIEKESKIVFILNDTSNNGWDENTLLWNYLDDSGWAGFSYDGTAGYKNQDMTPYFAGLLQYRSSIMGFSHDLTYFAGLASATKDDTVAYHVLRLLMHKIRELNCDFTSTEQPALNQNRVECFIEIFDRCRFSKYMTPEIFTTILKSVYEHCELIVGADRFKQYRSKVWTRNLKTSNLGALQNDALIQCAIVFNEFKAANAPLGELWEVDSYNGGWLAVVANRFKLCIDYSVLPDGSTTDIPINYLWTNVGNYINAFCSYSGLYNFDVNNIFSEDIVETLLDVGEYASNILNPIGGSWQVGDGQYYETKYISNLKSLFNAYPNNVSEHLKYIASSGVYGTPAKYTSFVGDETNTAILRSGWDKNAVSLNIQSSSNFQHTHSDDLGITMMAYGNYLLADPNRYTYLANDPISNWQISREAHNSIVVDETDAVKAGGSMHPEDRELNNVYDFIHGDSKGYANQFHERYITFVRPGYYIVTDHIDSSDDETHNYRQNWHFEPGANIAVNDYLQTYTQHPVKANITVAPVMKKGELENEILDGYYTYKSQSALVENHKYVTYKKDVVGDTSFQTVLYPTNIGKNVDIQTEILDSSIPDPDARAMRAIIKEDGVETETNYYLLLNNDVKAEVTYGNYKTDGTMSLTEHTPSGLSTIALRNGSYIEDTTTGKKIILMANLTEDIGISFEYDKAVIESSKDSTDINGMVIYVGNKTINSATYNGEQVSFSKKGKYIFFGDTPSYEIPDEEIKNDKEDSEKTDDSIYVPKEEPSGGNMSGGGGGGGSSSKEDKDDEDEKLPETIIPDTPVSPNLSEAFSEELENYWGKSEIAEMINNGYIKGADGKLNLQNKITRAEFIAVIVRALGIEDNSADSSFKDVNKDDWCFSALESAFSVGLINGYDGCVKPNDPITREQVAKILVSTFELKEGTYKQTKEISYLDDSQISQWANTYINKSSELGLMKGYVDNTFRPLSDITRGEAFVTIYRLLELTKK